MNFSSIVPQWGGNTFWQASKTPLTGFFNRIILKGTDIYIAIAVIFFYLKSKSERNIFNLLMLSLSLVGVLFSFTRTSILILMLILFLHNFRNIDFSFHKLKNYLAFLIGVVFFYFFLSAIGFQNAFDERVNQGSDESSLSWRQLESFLALSKSSEYNFMGGGFGTNFDMFLSGSNKEDEVSLYVHNLYVWLILKSGLLCLCLFVFMIFNCFNYLRAISVRNHESTIKHFLRYALIFLILNDFVNNKFSTFSGSLLYGLLFSIPEKIQHEI